MQTVYKYLGGNLRKYTERATYSCKHRVTKRPICAIPCDGTRELCENDADEQCQGPGITFIVIITFLLSTIFVLFSFSLGWLMPRQNITDEELESNGNGEDVKLKLTLFSHKNKMDIESAILVANSYHKEKTGLNRGQTVGETLMEDLGTNDLTRFFFDCVEGSLTIKFGLSFPQLITLWKKFNLGLLIELSNSVITLFLRYLDLSKDLLLLYIIWLQLGNYDSLSFPIAVFWTFFSAVVATEITNFFTISLDGNITGSLSRKIASVICSLFLTPLMPAFHIHMYIALVLTRFNLINTTVSVLTLKEQRNILHYLQKCLYKLKALSAKLQANENVVENFTQVTLLLMSILLSHSASRVVENIDNIFVDDNSSLGYVLVGISLMNMVRGQINYLVAHKNGCSSLKGTFILAIYFLIGTSTRSETEQICFVSFHKVVEFRIFALLLLFTPTLGLFDTLHHWRLGALETQDGDRIFGYSIDDSPITFQTAWSEYKLGHKSEFIEIPTIAVISLMIGMFLFHIAIVTLALKLLILKKSRISNVLLEAFHSFLTPPLHYDWELIYRDNSQKESVLKCWKRSAHMHNLILWTRCVRNYLITDPKFSIWFIFWP